MSNRRKGLLRRISRYLERLEMPFVETDQRNDREYLKIQQRIRNQLSFENDKEDSAHFEISSSNAHVEVDYKNQIRTVLFDSEDSLLKSNDRTKRIKISENEEYLQIKYDNYDHNLEKYYYSDDYEDECLKKPITYVTLKSSLDGNEEETEKYSCEEDEEEEIEKVGQILFENQYYQITKETTKCFKEGEMLNDEIIDAYVSLLNIQSSDIYVFETSFISLLEKYQNKPSEMLHFLGNYLFKKKIESISNFKKMLLPTYFDKHWMLFVINFEDQNIEWYDSVFDQLSLSKYETIKLFIRYLYFREKVECVSKIFCRRRVCCVKQTNTYDCGLDLCSNMYRIVFNKIVNLTRKTLKYQLFNGKIEEYLGPESKSGCYDDISSIKQNFNKEDYKINKKTKEASYKSNKIYKYENKLKDESIKIIRQECDQRANNLYIKPNQEMEEAGVCEKDMNIEVNNKSNKIRKEIEEEDVLNIETKQVNNGEVSDHDENDSDDYEKEEKENIIIGHKYHKKQVVRLNEINQEAYDIKFVESKLKGISKSGKCCKFVRQMMHKVCFIASNSYNLICNYLECKINRCKLSKCTIQKYLPGLIKAMHNCGIEFDNDNLKNFVEQCEPEMKTSEIIRNYQKIVDKAVSCKTHSQCKLLLADCLIYNLMFVTNCPEKMILSLKLNDICEYVDTTNSLMHNEYIIKLGEYDNIQISKQAYSTIYGICKVIDGLDSSKAMLKNLSSSNFHTRFSRYHTNYLSILTKFRKYQKGKWIESIKLNEFLNKIFKI